MLRRLALAAALSVASFSVLAQVSVAEPWVRGTVASQMGTGAFMKITAAASARLVGASSPVAGVVEIHEMALVNNVMRMRAVEALELPAGKAVELKPGGYHVMLMDLQRDLKEGETVPLTLVIEQGGKRQNVEVKAPVRSPTARHATEHGKMEHGKK
jgi:periplasmic copper chaperone A